MRLIDADALADRLDAIAYHDWNQGTSVSWADAFKVFAEMTRDERAIDAEPVKHGRWINISISANGGESSAECDLCGAVVHNNFSSIINYCPNCGAKMTGEKDGAL